MNFYEVENLRSVLNARWLRRPAKEPRIDGVGIDTREDLSGRAFIAIKGVTHDGHNFLLEAVKAGAGLFIVEREAEPMAELIGLPPSLGILQVEHTRQALIRLAQAYRRTLRGTKVIAITGSAGKTTTKRLVDAVLATQMQGSASPKSFNNDIGLPLTILQARPGDKYLVVEMGMNAPGEISPLAAIAEPDIAVITSIGRAHLEGLGSLEAIAKEKASILTHLKSEGVAILNADAALLRPHFRLAKHRILFGESDDADLRLTARGANGAGGWLEINNRQRFEMALPGRHNATNALAAIAVARRMGLDDQSIATGLKRVQPEAMRLASQQIGGATLYNDAYNANPDSVIAALETFAELEGGERRRVVILGDMLELGPHGPDLHREIGRRIVAMNERIPIDHVVLIGELSAFTASELMRIWPGERVTALLKPDDDATNTVEKLIRPGDAVLIKASRGMGLERVVEVIQRAATHWKPRVNVNLAHVPVECARR